MSTATQQVVSKAWNFAHVLRRKSGVQEIRCRKSGVSSSFLPEKMNRHRISRAGQSVAAQVSLRDLAATVADVTGLGGSPFPGRSLARHWAADASPLSEPSLSEVDAPVMSAPNQGRSPVFRGPMKAVAAGKHVYVRNGDGQEELFDVAADPMQSRNLAGLPQVQSILDQIRTDLDRLLQAEAPVTARSRKD
jgi:hypothetical protein